MYKYGIYGNSGGINSVLLSIRENTITQFETILKTLIYIAEKENCKVKDLRIHYYSYDSRIEKEIYMITKDGMFVSYLIEI